MKQVVQDVRKGETRVLEVPVPQVMPGTALVRTVASLVSVGTERALVEFAESAPRRPAHHVRCSPESTGSTAPIGVLLCRGDRSGRGWFIRFSGG